MVIYLFDMKTKIYIYFFLLFLFVFPTLGFASVPSDFFRSRASNTFNNVNTWESSSDNLNWVNANLTPTISSRGITIRNSHSVTITSNISLDDLSILSGGTVTINSGVFLSVNNGVAAKDITVFGTLNNTNGNVNIIGVLSFESGGVYEHNFNTTAGSIPLSTWENGSECKIIGFTNPSGSIIGTNQSFFNFTYNCPAQLNNYILLNFGFSTIIRNTFSLISSGAGTIAFFPGSNLSTQVKNFSQSGGRCTITFTGSGTVTGNLFISGDFNMTFGIFSNQFSGQANVIFNGTSLQTYSKTGGIFLGNFNVIVNTNAVVDFGNSLISGNTGSFSLNSGSTIRTSNTSGFASSGASGSIQNTGTRSYSTAANYIFNGTLAQNTGNGVPATVRKLIVTNPAGVTLRSGAINVTDSLIISSGSLDLGTNVLISTNGSFGSGTLFTQNTTATPISAGKTWIGEINFNAAGSQSIVGGNYSKLTTSTGGTKTVTGIANISNLVTVNSPSILNSNNNLTLLATATTNANIAALSGSADVSGNVNIQSYLYGVPSGRARGTKTMSSPINDDLIGGGKTFEQLKNFIPITGPGNTANGFDLGGTGNTNAITLNFYNEPASPTSSAFTVVPSLFTNTSPGIGFLAFFRGNRTNMYTVPGKLNDVNGTFLPAEDVLVTFTGPINKGNINVPIGFTNFGHSTDGYFVAGNPYPATIDWHALHAASTNLSTTILIVTGGKPNATYNSATGIGVNGGSRYIQPAQGFYVQSNSGGGTLSFRENQKDILNAPARLLSIPNIDDKISTNFSTSNLNTQNLKTSNNTYSPKELKIKLSNQSFSEEALIVFNQNDVSEVNNNDSRYLEGYNINLATLSSDGHHLSINQTPDADRIKILVNSEENATLNLEFPGIESNKWLLKDHYLNTEIMLNNNRKVYSFNIDKNVSRSFGTNRFELIKSNAKIELGLTNSQELIIYPNPAKDILSINLFEIPKNSADVSIFDLQGRKVKYINNVNTKNLDINIADLNKGVYIVEVMDINSNTLKSTAKFIKE